MMKSPYFPANEYFPDLYLFQTYVEFYYEVLFSCKTSSGILYLLNCYCADKEKKEWLATKTTPEKLIQLLENHLTIQELFTDPTEEKYLIHMDTVGKFSYKKVNLEEIPENTLPTPGYTMDSDPDEFNEEIYELNNCTNYNITNFVQTSTIIFEELCLNIVDNINTIITSVGDYFALEHEYEKVPEILRKETVACRIPSLC